MPAMEPAAPKPVSPDTGLAGGVMDNDKSILERITDTVKGMATLAADAASHALKAEEPPPKADQPAAADVPLAADGLVSDPLMAAPNAAASAPRKKRLVAKPAAGTAGSKAARKAAKKPARTSAGKAAKKPAGRKSRKAASKTPKQAGKKTASRVTKKARKTKRRA